MLGSRVRAPEGVQSKRLIINDYRSFLCLYYSFPFGSTRLAVAAKLIASLPAPTAEKQALTTLLEDMLRETPQTVLAALKFSSVLQTLSPLLARALSEAILAYAVPSAQRLLMEDQEHPR